MRVKNELGNKYGKLTVIAPSDEKIRSRACWVCQCECGTILTVIGTDLRTGRKTDCGCVPHYNFKDEIGHKYGRLTVIAQSDKKSSSRRAIMWECLCDCGTKVVVCGSDLRSGKTQSCGCLEQERRGQSVLKDEIGNRYGKLVVIDKIRPDNKTTYWKCKCDCGNITYQRGDVLRCGSVKSCGCLHSLGNQKIEQFLTEHKIIHKSEVAFNDLISSKGGHPRFDFGIYDDNYNLLCLIEYQGIQHFIDKGKFGQVQREETDQLKMLYCQDHNITLYEINYEDDIESKLLEIIEEVFHTKEKFLIDFI